MGGSSSGNLIRVDFSAKAEPPSFPRRAEAGGGHPAAVRPSLPHLAALVRHQRRRFWLALAAAYTIGLGALAAGLLVRCSA